MSTLTLTIENPVDDRDFVEIPMSGTTRELAQIQGEGSSPEPIGPVVTTADDIRNSHPLRRA
jgi:hypothetical protein